MIPQQTGAGRGRLVSGYLIDPFPEYADGIAVAVVLADQTVRKTKAMRSTKTKPLLNLAAAVLIAQSSAMPHWGAHLLSCGFTHALRTIESAERAERANPVLANGSVMSNAKAN